VLWITGFGLGTVAVFLAHNTPNEMKGLFLVMWPVGSAFIYWWCIRLKRVRMDETYLYVSNYRREARIPLRQVAAVSENRWVNIHPVTIEFRSSTEFGDRVIFMPKMRWLGFWTSHPVVAQIREAAARAAAS
jgi:hypothetical protein